jgi:excisionase family DNA binding protein
MESNHELLTADETATLLKVRQSTIYDWAAKGVLPHVRILAGKRRPVLRFRRLDVEAFIVDRMVWPARESSDR